MTPGRLVFEALNARRVRAITSYHPRLVFTMERGSDRKWGKDEKKKVDASKRDAGK